MDETITILPTEKVIKLSLKRHFEYVHFIFLEKPMLFI